MNEKSKSYLMLISSMLVFGTIGIFRKFIPVSSSVLAFARGIIGGLCLLIFLLFKKSDVKIKPKDLAFLFLSGAFIGINWILLFESYNYTSVATATLCYYMQPTIVILLSPVVLKEKLTGKKLLCAFLAIVGMVLVSGILTSNENTNLKGILFGLGAACFYSAVIFVNKKYSFPCPYKGTAVQLFSAAAVLVPYIVLTENLSEISLSPLAVIMTVTVGIIHTGVAYLLYFASMKNLSGQSIAILSYIDPVFALILSFTVLRENFTLFGLIGAVLIIGSAILGELKIKKQ